MPNILSFSEDMLPRHFPRAHFSKATEQLEQISVVPQPTLPGVSLIFAGEKNFPTFEPKKSFQKWKEQHQAILTNKSTDHQMKAEKKHVRFEAKPPTWYQPPTSQNLELSYFQSPNSKRDNDFYPSSNIYHRPNLHHQNQHYQQTFYRPHTSSNTGVTLKSEFVNGGLNRSQTNIKHHQYDRNRFSGTFAMGQNHQKQLQTPTSDSSESNPCCCHRNENCTKIKNHESNDQTEYGSNGMPERLQVVQELQPSVRILINILEEQQRHILFQQNQIAMHEKENLEQEKQICTLQYQIQQLLHLYDAIDSHSPVSEHKSVISNAMSNGLEFESKTQNGYHCTPSIGMSSFLNDDNDKCEREKLVLNQGASDKYSCQDVLLDRTDTNMRNSSPFTDYGIDEHVNVSANRQFDTNIGQTLTYEALSSSCSYGISQKETERSYYLNMLGMKYKCTQGDSPLYTDEHEEALCYNQLSVDAKSDRFREGVSLNTYDYLIRHGLVKR